MFANFVYLLKEPVVVLLIFTIVSFIYFHLDLYDFFPSTNIEGFFFVVVVLLFPVVLGIKLGCLFNVLVGS